MENRAKHALAIAFLNARAAFDDPASAARWWSGIAGATDGSLLLDPESPKPRFNAALAAELQALQSAAVDAFGAGSEEAAQAALSAALAHGSLRLKGSPPTLCFCASSGPGAVLFPVAHAVASLLASGHKRLRRCANQACAAFFWDGTKNGSRRWCRLRCMERVRAPRRRLQR